MFDISWGKLVIIGVVALIVIGPKELPAVLRTMGQWLGKIRRMAGEFQGQFQEAMREAEMADLKKQFDETASALNTIVDPVGIKAGMEKLINDPMGLEKTASSTPAAPSADTTLPTPATSVPEAALPTDPVALGTGPAAPEISVPMPELPAQPQNKDFADATAASAAAPAPAPAAPKPEGDKAA